MTARRWRKRRRWRQWRKRRYWDWARGKEEEVEEVIRSGGRKDRFRRKER